MENIESILTQLLNFGEGWIVKELKIDETIKEVDIFLEYIKSVGLDDANNCFKIYDFGKMRRIRHLDLLQYKCFLNYRTPRIKNEKGQVRSLTLPFVDKRVSFSYLFENKVIEALQMSKNQIKTASFFDCSFDIVHGIMCRGVERGLKRRKLEGLEALSLDEKSFSNGHNYLTILSDPINKCVLDVTEGRKMEDAETLLVMTISPEQLEKVKIVSMDMWKAYMGAVNEILPHAEIIHDKFHTAKYLNKAVDDVRKQEIKKETVLKNTKYLFLKNQNTWTDEQSFKFSHIDAINLQTAQAWKMKENFKGIYQIGNKYLCLEYFEEWYKNVLSKEIKPMIKVADTLAKHLRGIVNSAIYEVSNSVAESLNSQIQIVKSVARGYANFNGYRNAILFFQGKLNLYPL